MPLTAPVQVSVTPTIQAAAYSAGNCMGGVQTLAGALRTVSGKATLAVLQDLTIIDKGNQKSPLTILFFDAPPASTYTDKVTPTIGADAGHIIGQLIVAATDYTSSGADTPQIAVADKVNLGIVLSNKDPSTTNDLSKVYVVILTTGTPTPASASDLTFKFKIGQY